MEETTVKQRILFVDDEPNILLGLKRLLRSHRHEWDMQFVNGGDEALELLKTETFQIIVSDLRMPGTTGVQLLDKVKTLYPDMIRFILSGHGDTDMIIQSVGVAHQFMAKPCDADLFQEAITRATRLQRLFKSDMLMEIVKDGSSLPTLPELYTELTEELKSPNSTADKVAQVISKDVSITAKVLQLVNSAFFGLSRNIDNIGQAVGLLGGETINNIVLVTQVFGKFDESQVQEFGIREIYSHSLAVGTAASRLTKAVTKNRKLADEAMLAGMVHDLGKLVLINSNNEAWRQLYKERKTLTKPFYQAERDLLGVTHAEVGAYLIGLWGLSNKVVEAVAYHTDPSNAPCTEHFDSLSALYVANVFDIYNRGNNPEFGEIEWDTAYLESVGITDKIEEYAQICSVEDDAA